MTILQVNTANNFDSLPFDKLLSDNKQSYFLSFQVALMEWFSKKPSRQLIFRDYITLLLKFPDTLVKLHNKKKD